LVYDFDILGNISQGKKFLESVEKKKFFFSFVISYTKTCEIPRITIAGANPEILKFTPPADAEYLHYGHCKSIDGIPMTPDGKPTPAILTKVALEAASIPHVVINAGSKVSPQLPYFETKLDPGNNITQEPAMTISSVIQAVDYGRIIARTLASMTDCLIIGESIPGGTTTALALMKGLGINAKVSSSMPKNPVDLKNKVVENALRRFDSKEPYEIISNVGDPMIPVVAGMLSAASEISNVILAGGTQMAAVLAFAKKIGFKENRVAIGTTNYIINDKTSNLLEILKQISDIPVFVAKPMLENSKIDGLKAFSEGFAKEGAGAGGVLVSAMMKINISAKKLLELTEKEYRRLFTLQSQT